MLSLVLLIAVLNMALGFALALGLEFVENRRNTESAPTDCEPIEQTEAVADEVESPLPEPTPLPPPPVKEPVAPDNLPAQWKSLLEQTGIVPNSFVEAAVHVFRLDIGPYRNKLLDFQDRASRRMNRESDESLGGMLEEIRAANTEWLERQSNAIGEFSDRRGKMAELEHIAAELEEILMHQASQIESACGNMDAMYMEVDQEKACQRLFHEIGRLTEMASLLQDRMMEAYTTILRLEGRLGVVDPMSSSDPETGMANRIGCEAGFESWRREDLGRQRATSYILLDVDQCAQLNDTHGARMGDRILKSIGTILSEECDGLGPPVRKSRITGQSYLFFIPDVKIDEAGEFADRLRQSIKSTTFDTGTAQVDVTMTCAVTSLGKTERFADMMSRANRAMKEAKKAGRNRTAVQDVMKRIPEILPSFDSGGTPRTVDLRPVREEIAAV